MAVVISKSLGFVQTLKTRKREMFWTWIAYQTIKGILTTSLIWVPLMIAFLGK